jgi:predicted CxxxxCH...CXXCH cytochrome family protein
MSDGVSRKVAELVIERDQGMCVVRVTHDKGAKAGEQIHHRRPRGMGGTTVEWVNQAPNLIYVCAACHAHIERYREQAMTMGWLLNGKDRAENTPLRYSNKGFKYLTTDGQVVDFLVTPWDAKA